MDLWDVMVADDVWEIFFSRTMMMMSFWIVDGWWMSEFGFLVGWFGFLWFWWCFFLGECSFWDAEMCVWYGQTFGGKRVFERVCFFLKQKRADHFSSLCFSNWHAFARPIYIAFCSEQQQTKQQKQKTNNKTNKQTKTPSINHQTICRQHTYTHMYANACMYVREKKRERHLIPSMLFWSCRCALLKGCETTQKRRGEGTLCFVLFLYNNNKTERVKPKRKWAIFV